MIAKVRETKSEAEIMRKFEQEIGRRISISRIQLNYISATDD